MKIENLNFSVRVYNCLKRAGIDTVEQLEKMSDNDLMALRNFGVSCLAEVRQKVAQAKKPFTNGDRIRGVTDEELSRWASETLHKMLDAVAETYGVELKYTDEEKERWRKAVCEWLQQPADVPHEPQSGY